jgi:hypothetical protein
MIEKGRLNARNGSMTAMYVSYIPRALMTTNNGMRTKNPPIICEKRKYPRTFELKPNLNLYLAREYAPSNAEMIVTLAVITAIAAELNRI